VRPWTLAELAEITQGEVSRGGVSSGEIAALTIGRIVTDSRDVQAGDVFIALSGERFDGHAFVAEAAKQGAGVAIVETARVAELSEQTDGMPLIGVNDTRRALGLLGQAHRRRLSAKIIAVVGSNGKTTTRELIQHVLCQSLPGRAAIKSFNNAVGVPLTLLSGQEADAYLVVEIGTNAPGEVAELAALTEPDIAIITSLGYEHLAGFGDLAGVVAEECAILPFVENGLAVVNIDEPRVDRVLEKHSGRVLTYGSRDAAQQRLTAADSHLDQVRFKHNDSDWISLPMPGVHNALNALGAMCVAEEFGIGLDEAGRRLAGFQPPPMRCNVWCQDGVTLIDDTYNANPSSMLAAGTMLASYASAKRRILVLGAMAELGDEEAAWHERIAEQLVMHAFEAVHLIAPAAQWMQAAFAAGQVQSVCEHADVDACATRLLEDLSAGDVVLVKASRSQGLERVVEQVREALVARSTSHAV
jgi:UDP-N-acetylmuramoyl-tripeptide--D-alanyl-D-alanine ligase